MVRKLVTTGALLFVACTFLNYFLGVIIGTGEEPFTSTIGKETWRRRFPKYGTEAFARVCPWTEQEINNSLNCTILARPIPPYLGEGISNWLAQIVTGHLLSKQSGCRFLFDYGAGIDINKVVVPDRTNWTVPYGFDCERDPLCYIAPPRYSSTSQGDMMHLEAIAGRRLFNEVPYYRFAYAPTRDGLSKNAFFDLEQVLPGFSLETGMACSLGGLFHLAPCVSQFEPELYSKILPTLNANDALVLSLYIRTDQTDHENVQENEAQHRKSAETVIRCALELEKKHLDTTSFFHVVWLVATDSRYVKQWIARNYDSRHEAKIALPIQREVVTTRSRGLHTKTHRGPSTADFAEALIDWYLIGESDLVVSDAKSRMGRHSFGVTAALRTARPFYKAKDDDGAYVCSRAHMEP